MLVIVFVFFLLCQTSVFLGILRTMIGSQRHLVVLSFASLLSLMPSMFVLTKSSYSLAVMPFIFLWIGFFYQTVCLAFAQSPIATHQLRGSVATHLLQWVPYVASFLIFIAVLGSAKPFEPHSTSRPLYDRVTALGELLPDRHLKIAGLGVSTYANYLGWDRIEAIEVLFVTSRNSGDRVNLATVISQYQPDVILIDQVLLSSANFDTTSLSVLNEGWISYPFGDGNIYLSSDIARKPQQVPLGISVSPGLGVLFGTGWYDFEPSWNMRWMQRRDVL